MSRRIAALLLCFVLTAAFVPLCVRAEGEINLASGLPYTVMTGEPVTGSYGRFTENGVEFDVDKGQLTDSTTALLSEASAGWYRAFRAKSRLVSFDLGSICAVSGVKAGFLNVKNSGVYAPRYVNVYLSHDGENYTKIYEYLNDFPIWNTVPARCDIDFTLDRTYAARYVRIEFCTDIFCYCDEIQIMGKKTPDGTESDFTDSDPAEAKGYFKSLAGVSDVIKIYNGYYKSDRDTGLNTEEELLPYVAYLSQNGEIRDTMFDSVAFVPCHTDYPSGGRLVKTNGKPGAVMSDWELYHDMTFAEGYDLHALDATVGKVYEELGREGKFKVFLTMPYPTVLDGDFGDIDGDGVPEKCATLADRTAICAWYADKCVDSFAEAKFANLELAGFYWYREEVNYSDSDHEAELVSAVTAYVRSKKLVTLFDPFYLSTGYDHWQSLGFDGAVMQPNAAFYTGPDGYFKIEMLSEFAVSAYNNNVGVEIETEEPLLFTGNDYLKYGRDYESYLYYGCKTGYMDSLKTYYQGAGPGTFYLLCNAGTATPKGIYLRRLYDLTYRFIKGEYENAPPTFTVEDFETVSGAKRTVVDISVTDDDSYWGDVEILFPRMPEHGDVAAASSKHTLVYYADADFVGEDSFTVVVSDGFNRSEEVTVHVTVLSPEPAESSAVPSDPSESSDSDPAPASVPLWLIITLSALGAAVVIVAAILTAKRLKKK